MGLFNKKNKTEETVEIPAADSPAVDVTDTPLDGELIAVIAAAVSAYESEQFNQTLFIRKLSRAAGARPAWGGMGTQEAIDMRRI
jgi:hypothetical protein